MDPRSGYPTEIVTKEGEKGGRKEGRKEGGKEGGREGQTKFEIQKLQV